MSARWAPSEGCEGGIYLWSVDGHLYPVSLHIIFLLYVSVSVFIFPF